MKHIKNQSFGEERALYGSDGIYLLECAFDGAEDGESALKESKNILVERCRCNLRYPFWHDVNIEIRDTLFTESCRAALWYSHGIKISASELLGTKALRESSDVMLDNCEIDSDEFGWHLKNVRLEGCRAKGEYFMLGAESLNMKDTRFKGKYSLQYVNGGVIENCILDTKDALWHAKDVTLSNCVVNGEYLGWYSENITFINCIISGTQPLCYCKGLKLVDCEMHGADLAFERSHVEATVTTPIISIKNAYSGYIEAPSVGEIISDDKSALCKIRIK